MTTLAAAKRRTALIAAAFALAMVGLAYASVPLYRLFCEVTGFNGTTQRADAVVAGPASTRTMKVRFDGNVSAGLPWRFRPVATETSLPIGQSRLAFYRASNTSDRPITGTAVFNVTPDIAGRYFVKIACFCFEEQTLKPGQTVDMPVQYYIDPAILDDPQAGKIDEITLSYTFFPVEPALEAAANTKG